MSVEEDGPGLPGTVTEERAAQELSAGDLLLDNEARRRAAGVDEKNPFGKRGPAFDKNSPMRRGMGYALGALVVLISAYVLYTARSVLVLILIAAFLTIGLNPVVTWLQSRKVHRAIAVSMVMGMFVLFIVGFLALAGPPLFDEASELADEVPEYAERVRNGEGALGDLDRRYKISERVETAASSDVAQQAVGGAVGIGVAILGAVVSALTVLILTLYFLMNFETLKNSLYRMAPRSRRARVGLIGDEVLRRTGGYLLGAIATSFTAGVATAIFLSIVGVPYALALGMFVAIVGLIPLIGASIGGLAVTVVAFFVSVPVGLITLAYYLIYQQIENYVIVPTIMKKTVAVSPVTTVVAVLIGGSLLGILGALLAIPIAAAVQLLFSEIYYPKQDAS